MIKRMTWTTRLQIEKLLESRRYVEKKLYLYFSKLYGDSQDKPKDKPESGNSPGNPAMGQVR